VNGVDWMNKSAGYSKRTAGTLRQLTSGRAPHHFGLISVELEADSVETASGRQEP